MISLVFDCATDNDFSGNRIVIVCRRSELLDTVKITDCLDPRRYNVKCVNPPPHRFILSRNRDRTESEQWSLDPVLKNSASPSRLCTIFFELVENSRLHSAPNFIVQLALLSQRPPEHALRILYDHTRVWTSTRESTVLFLESSHSLRPRVLTAYRRVELQGISAHSVRILPLSMRRVPFVHLPPAILTCVAQHAFGDRNIGWRSGLLSFGLVCKAWTPLLDLYFSNSHNLEVVDLDQADASKVARSLERRPERGALIQKFSPYEYRLHFLSNADDWKTFWQSQNAILRLATAVKHLHITCTHQSLFEDFVATLCLLKNVRSLRVSSAPSACSTLEASTELRSLTTYDIQHIISQWMHLRSLYLFNWNLVDANVNPNSNGALAPETTQAFQMMCKIEVLTLHNGVLTGPQLVAFTSPARPVPSLHTVDICNIHGLNNRDLLAFLSQISPSLGSLAIHGCVIPREPNEEYALDSIMPQMVRIYDLKSDGDIASPLVLARKVRRERGDRREKDSITITYSLSMELRNMVKALEDCNWDSVNICWGGAVDDGLLETALKITESRGIKFTLVAFPRPLE
ncbi:hypothetical protein LshimejAT787_0202190 [Lyophyllum shimeji]|uniref:Uncharacterized protein n=1 Tax=Lyophyllum shimeji TaxID=47721 RepID=A0A9P3PFN5_LYOSH|nr:hypothetical protein LshimejAT787_0202190 [Lyophyllum shimeji]